MAAGLVNLSNTPFVATLYHDVFCAAQKACGCEREQVTRPVRRADGTFGNRTEMRLIPKSITVPERGRLLGLPQAVLEIPQVKAAMKQRPPILRAIIIDETAAATPIGVAPSPTPSQPGGGSPVGVDKTRSRRSAPRGRSEG